MISYRWSKESVHSSLHKILWNGQREKPKIPRCANGQQDRRFIVAKSRHTGCLLSKKILRRKLPQKTSLTVNVSAVGKLRRLNKSSFLSGIYLREINKYNELESFPVNPKVYRKTK